MRFDFNRISMSPWFQTADWEFAWTEDNERFTFMATGDTHFHLIYSLWLCENHSKSNTEILIRSFAERRRQDGSNWHTKIRNREKKDHSPFHSFKFHSHLSLPLSLLWPLNDNNIRSFHRRKLLLIFFSDWNKSNQNQPFTHILTILIHRFGFFNFLN